MRITILGPGGGTGGIITGRKLCKKICNEEKINPVKIILFEKEEKNVFAPSLLWLLVGKRKPEQVYRNTGKVADNGVEVLLGEIEKVNPQEKTVAVNGNEYKGDYMVISLGVEQVTEHNLDKFGYDFYTLAGATQFYERLKEFTGGKITVVFTSLPFNCPAAPYEAAMLIESFIRKKGLCNKTEISLYTPEPGPMPVAGKELSGAVKQIIEKKGIKCFPEHQLTSVTINALTFANGKTANYDLLAYTPKHQCPKVIKESALAGKLGWIESDRNTMKTIFPNVYAIGDITFIPLEMGKPLPKAGVFTHYQAEIVAHNIAKKIEGKTPDKTFNRQGQCFLELGGGKAGYAGGNFYGSPFPVVKMKTPGCKWLLTKVMFEKYRFFKYC